MNETNNMTYLSKSLHEIPWHLPLCKISLTFPDNSLTLKKNNFSPTFPWRVATQHALEQGSDLKSKADKLLSSGETRIRTVHLRHPLASRRNAHSQTGWDWWQNIDGQNVVRFGISVAMTLFSPCQLYRFFIRRIQCEDVAVQRQTQSMQPGCRVSVSSSGRTSLADPLLGNKEGTLNERYTNIRGNL